MVHSRRLRRYSQNRTHLTSTIKQLTTMYRTPRDYPDDLSFEEANDALEAINEALKEHYDSTDFLVKFNGDEIEIEFGDF